MNIELFKRTHEFIQRQIDSLANPCVACSFGKDSMVVLDIARRFQPDIPVVYIEQFPIESKHAFARQVAKAWNLNMVNIRPSWRTFYGKKGHVEILTVYHLNQDGCLVIPAEPTLELDESNAICGLDALNEPLPRPDVPCFDGVFIGQRNDDKDIVLGDLRIAGNESVLQGGIAYVYPLKDWTSKDVWDYHRRYEVPANEARYGNNDPDANNDVWNICTRCLSGEGEVYCPKDQTTIRGFGDFVDLGGLTIDARQSAINLENA